jgi:hypothetical protein
LAGVAGATFGVTAAALIPGGGLRQFTVSASATAAAVLGFIAFESAKRRSEWGFGALSALMVAVTCIALFFGRTDSEVNTSSSSLTTVLPIVGTSITPTVSASSVAPTTSTPPGTSTQGRIIETTLREDSVVDIYPGVSITVQDVYPNGVGPHMLVTLPQSDCSLSPSIGERVWIPNHQAGGPIEYMSIQVLSADPRNLTAKIRTEWPLTGSYPVTYCR